jgi:hypothetical protein
MDLLGKQIITCWVYLTWLEDSGICAILTSKSGIFTKPLQGTRELLGRE